MSDHYVHLGELVRLAEKFYPKKKFIHATRVATYAMEKAILRRDIKPEEAYAVGLAHDLLEDTECTCDDLDPVMDKFLIGDILALSKNDGESYDHYIADLLENGSELAKLVKGADMKDHMMQTETLTEKLWEKYKPHLKYFL